MKDKVLAVMKEAGEPLNAGKIAELSGLDFFGVRREAELFFFDEYDGNGCQNQRERRVREKDSEEIDGFHFK